MMLPNGWKKVKLGDILTAVDYGTAAKSDVTGKYPVLRMGNLENGYLVWDNLVYTSSEEEYAKYELKKGDILFNRTNSRDKVGKTSIYCGECPSIFAGYLIRLKVNSECDPYYVNYCMNSKKFAEFCKSVRTDAIGQSNINAQVLQTYEFRSPPIRRTEEDCGDASVWDSAIEKMEKLIEAKIVQKNSLTCKLIEKSSEAKFKLENVTIDKSKWERKRLGELLEFKNGVNVEKDKIGHGTKMISVLDILSDKPITYDNIRSSVALTTEELSIYSVHYGDVLFQRSSENYEDVGTSNVYIDEKCATFSGFVIRGKKNGAYNPFCLNAILRAPSARCQIMRKAAGAQHVNIGQESLANIQIFLPTLLEQKVIADVLSAIDDELTLLKQQLENYKKQKQGLMQKTPYR
jgi:Restriction endonuclease S subunits